MKRLSQAVAIRAVAQKQAEETLNTARDILGKDGLLRAIQRTYQPLNDEGERLPDEIGKIQHSGPETLQALVDDLVEFWDVNATVDWANCTATADLVLDGTVLIENAPTTYLLFLGTQLDVLEKVVRRLPTLDPALYWDKDPTSGSFKTRPIETIKTKKVPQVLLKHSPTKEHPAQTEVYYDDVPVGTWTKVEVSSAWPLPDVVAMLERIHDLQRAVKLAREEANTHPVTKMEVARPIFEHLFPN